MERDRPSLRAAGLTLLAQSPGGLLVVKRDQRTFVVTFGHARQKLEDEWLERDFGRRVALNSIAKNGLVEIRAEQVFARWHLASDRAPRASAVEDFGVEFDRDLVASVEGVPSDKSLGKTVRGSTSLRLSLPLSSLGGVLDKTEKLFASTAYRKHWPEIDNLSPVKDQGLVLQLDAHLDTESSFGAALKKLVLFTPTHRRDEALTPDSYVFGRMSKTPATTPYLTVDSWANHLAKSGGEPSVGAAKQTHVHLMDDAKSELKTCSVYDCFGCEIGFNGNTSVLSSGVWYEVVPEFLTRINKAVAKIGPPALALPAAAQAPTATMARPLTRNVATSNGGTPKSRCWSDRPAATAPASPSATPISTTFRAPNTTSRNVRPPSAPSPGGASGTPPRHGRRRGELQAQAGRQGGRPPSRRCDLGREPAARGGPRRIRCALTSAIPCSIKLADELPGPRPEAPKSAAERVFELPAKRVGQPFGPIACHIVHFAPEEKVRLRANRYLVFPA